MLDDTVKPMAVIEELVQALKDPASGLHDRIVHDIGLFTVGLLRVSPSKNGERLDLVGTGTLVSFGTDRYILTASHVWEKLLQTDAPTKVGVTLKENIDHASLIDRDSIVAVGPPKPAAWSEWGPDLIFLRVPLSMSVGLKFIESFSIWREKGLSVSMPYASISES